MKKLIYLICATVLLLSGCMTVNRIERNCDKFAKICITEKETVTEYRDTTIYRTDTVLVRLPRDTVRLTDTVTVQNGLAYLAPLHREFGIIGVDASVRASVLNVHAYLKDSTFLYLEPDTVRLPGAIKTQTVTNTVPVKYIPGFYKFTFWLFWIVVAIIVLIIFWWVLRNFTPVFKTVLLLCLLGAGFQSQAQSWEFVEKFDGDTKQTILFKFKPGDIIEYLLVVDTVIPVYRAESSGQYYFKRDTTVHPHLRHYLGFKKPYHFENFSVFSDKSNTENWIWIVNEKGELEKSVAAEWMYVKSVLSPEP